MGAPLIVGYGEGENYLGSDALALAPLTQRIAYLDEGDWAVVRRDRIEIFDRDNQPVEREIVESGASSARRSRRAITATTCRRRSSSSRWSSPTRCKAMCGRSRARSRCPIARSRPRGGRPRDDRRLRHQLLRRAGRQILVRAVRARAGRHRCRVASSATASRCSSRAGWRCSSSQSGETADTLAALRHARARAAAHRGRRQRADQLDGARGRPAAADPRRAGDRRRLDQGVHLPAGGARRARRQPGAGQGAAEPRRGAGDRRAPAGSARGAQRRARP